MKHIVLSLLAVGLCATATAGDYVIRGTVTGQADGKYVYLFNRSIENPDSAVVEGGKFELRGTIDGAAFCTFALGRPDFSRGMRQGDKTIAQVAIDPCEMTATVDAADVTAMTLTGSKTNDDYRSYEALGKEAYKRMGELREAEQAAKGDTAREAAIDRELGRLTDGLRVKQLSWVKAHPASQVSAYAMRFLMGDLDYKTLCEVWAMFTPEVKASEMVKDVADEIATLAKVQPGSAAPDFTATDINGKPFTLSSLKGKTVILDFWASWCGPCRRSNPHLLALYTKYHDRGLEIVCVSDDDSNPAAWRKAVEKDQTQAFHHVLRGLKIIDRKTFTTDKSADISDRYAIHYLPTKYLIASDGNIIGKMADDKQIDQELARIFGE